MPQFIPFNTKLGDIQFSPNWHEQHVVVPLAASPTDHAAARSAIAQLMAELQRDNRPFDWDAEVAHRVNGQLIDAEQWTPSFGEDGDLHSAGVVRADPMRNTTGDSRFYVVARTGSGAAGARLNQFVLSNPAMTVGEFVKTPQYRVTEEYAKRNALRICALIAGALTDRDVKALVPAVADNNAAATIGSNIAAPMLAVPSVHHSFNTLAPAHTQVGGLMYVGAETSAVGTSSSALIAYGASEGFVLRPIGADRAEMPLVQTQHHTGQQSNEKFWRRQANAADHRQHVYSHFVTRTGETPSSASRVLWAESGIGSSIRADDTPLSPYVLVVYGKPPRNASVAV